MKHRLSVFAILLCAVGARAESRCAAMQAVPLKQMTVVSAREVNAGAFQVPHGDPIANVPAFCRVQIKAQPTAESRIGIEVWMPLTAWNGRLLGTGNGGFAGRFAYGSLANGIRQGYATANTDTGTNPEAGYFPSSEVIVDWASRSVHLMTVAAEEITSAFYGTKAKRRYFSGCSSGGQEALTEAQRYPEDYDGILAGAPAHDRVDLHVAALWNWLAVHHGQEVLLTSHDLQLLSNAVTRACPSVGGVVMDPTACRFDPSVLSCKADAKAGECLTPEQIAAVKKIYSGPVNPRTGRQIYPGLSYGSESQWTVLLAPEHGDGSMPYVGLFKAALGNGWKSAAEFRFDEDTEAVEKRLSAQVNATDPNLDAFRAHGGKILLTHGWADPIISPGRTIQYAEKLQQRYGASSDAFVRLYMIPGQAHCGGGPGAARFDSLQALTAWVEEDRAPREITAVDGTGQRSALLCTYPAKPEYRGTGSRVAASAYSCVEPKE